MKHSIRKEDVKYVVNPEEKKVVAYIEGTSRLFINFLEENFPHWYGFHWDDHKFANGLMMPNRFCGISTCGPDDEWNEDTGRLIAFDRMKDSLNKSFFKRANTFVNEWEKRLDLFCDRTNAYGQKLEYNTNRRKALIEKILGSDTEE